MLSLYRTLSLRYLSRRWFRALLIVASIALGVATLVATRALNQTMQTAALGAANPIAGTADFVVSNGEVPVRRDLAKELHQVPGVKAARPRIFDNAKIVSDDKAFHDRNVLVMGIDLEEEMKEEGTMQDLTFSDKAKYLFGAWVNLKNLSLLEHLPQVAKWFPAEQLRQLFAVKGKLVDFPAVVGKELDAELSPKELVIQVRKNAIAKKTYAVYRAGWIEGRGHFSILSGSVLVTDIDSAAQILEVPPGQAQRIDITLKPDASRAQTRKELERVLAGRAKVGTPEEQNQSLQSVMDGMVVGFTLGGLAALVVGMFLVYMSLSVSVAERRHEIGVLRSLGCTQQQVVHLFQGEALTLGLIGALLGIPLGYGLALVGLAPVQDVLREIFGHLEARQVEFSWPMSYLAVAVGMATALVASLVPALAASRENPAEAVRRMPKAAGRAHFFAQLGLSLALMLGGALLVAFRARFPFRVGTYGGLVAVLLGALIACPLYAALLAKLLRPIVRLGLGIEWRLAADNLVRSPARTGLVIGALAAGVALIVQTAGVIRSNRLALRDWIQESISADLIVTAGSPVSSGAQNLPMPFSVSGELTKVPEVEAALPIRYRKIPFRDKRILVLALDAPRAYEIETRRLSSKLQTMRYLEQELAALPEDQDHQRRTLQDKLDALRQEHRGHDSELYKALADQSGRALISINFSVKHGVDVGDMLTLSSPHGEVTLAVVGKLADYSWNDGSIFLDRRDFIRYWGDEQVDVFDLYLRPGANPIAVKDELNRLYSTRYLLYVSTREELQAQIDNLIERLYGIAYGQQVVVMLVAALGVVTALLISVLQRRREMGLLRAIGASQGQVIRSVLAEACLMGVIGTFIGLVVGIPLEWFVLQVIIFEESGFFFPLYIPWLGALVIALAALATATLAGLGPAVHAVRTRIPEAIAYE